MLITESDINNKISNGQNPFIVSFGAEWSGNTEMLSNMLQDLHHEFGEQVDVCLADIDVYPDLADQYGISEVPTTLIFNNGEVADFFTGLLSKGRIRQKIEACLVY